MTSFYYALYKLITSQVILHVFNIKLFVMGILYGKQASPRHMRV